MCGQLAKRKVESLYCRVEELDFELAIGSQFGLPDELVEPLFNDSAIALAVDVYAMCGGRRLTIEEHAIANGRSSHGRTHDEIEIPRMKPVCNSSARLVQPNGLFPNSPASGKRPGVAAQSCRAFVSVALVPRSMRRSKILSLFLADVSLRRSKIL